MKILAVIHKDGAGDDRTDSRRPVDLNATFTKPGAAGVACVVSNISAAGFMAKTYDPLIPNMPVWLRIPGLAALPGRVIWCSDGQIGCEFDQPLDPGLLDFIIAEAPQVQ